MVARRSGRRRLTASQRRSRVTLGRRGRREAQRRLPGRDDRPPPRAGLQGVKGRSVPRWSPTRWGARGEGLWEQRWRMQGLCWGPTQRTAGWRSPAAEGEGRERQVQRGSGCGSLGLPQGPVVSSQARGRAWASRGVGAFQGAAPGPRSREAGREAVLPQGTEGGTWPGRQLQRSSGASAP